MRTVLLNATRGLVCGLVVVASLTMSSANGQERFRPASVTDYRDRDHRAQFRPDTPKLSESTAILEAAVRTMYKNIEPGSDTSPNELLAYADLRALRLYTGALEVAGWSFEQAVQDYWQYQEAGAYRNGRNRITDQQALVAMEKFRAYRETVRTLLFRVRQTAVSVEHQVSFCDPVVGREWRSEVLPALRDAIAATEPLFEEELAYQRYTAPGVAPVNIVQTSANGIPRDAVEVSKYRTYAPYDGKGRGQGRFVEVRSFGGSVYVKAIRFRSHENALGLLGTSVVREIPVDQVVEPGQPLYIPANRGRFVDMSDLEIEWADGDRGRRAYGHVELVESSPNDRARD